MKDGLEMPRQLEIQSNLEEQSDLLLACEPILLLDGAILILN
jgi:hypothetical protein